VAKRSPISPGNFEVDRNKQTGQRTDSTRLFLLSLGIYVKGLAISFLLIVLITYLLTYLLFCYSQPGAIAQRNGHA